MKYRHAINSDYKEGGAIIKDGGKDMYDGGNCIQVPASTSNYVRYLSSCKTGTVNGQSYMMRRKNSGISVTTFWPYRKSSISIKGNLGADGKGSYAKGSYQYKGWKGFWKVVYGTKDPGINHLWVTNAPSPSHSISTNTNNDYDRLNNVKGYNVIYMMWATSSMRRSMDSVMRNLVVKVALAAG